MITKQPLENAKLLEVIIGGHYIKCDMYSFLPNNTVEFDSSHCSLKNEVSNYDTYIKSFFPINATFVKFYEESPHYSGNNTIAYKYIVTY